MKELESFELLVASYISNVELSLGYLEKYSEEKLHYQETRKGYLNEEKSLYFSFHGTGCLFINNGTEVDFELPLLDDSGIALDAYFLKRFWESNQDKFSYTDSSQILSDFQKAKNSIRFTKHPFRSHQIMVPFTKKFNLFG